MTAARRRVLHVSQPTEGGTARVVEQITAAATTAGHVVTVACPDGELARWTRQAGLRWEPLALRRAPEPRDVLHVAHLRRLSLVHDVVHLHSSKAGAVGRAAVATIPVGRRPLCIFTPHGWSWYVGGRSASVYRRFEHLAARWADVITPVSSSEMAAGRSVLAPSAWSKLVQIDNGVDTEEFTPAGPASPKADGPMILCVGRLSEQKGQDVLLAALPNVRHASAKIRLLGAGPLRHRLEVLAREEGISARVDFVAPEDPRPHYRSADLVVLPSRWEGLPLVLLEAMACGSTVIASHEAAADVLGDCGLVLPRGTGPDGLALAIDSLLDDPGRRTAMAAAARERVLRLHQLTTTTQRYLSLLDPPYPKQRKSVPNDRWLPRSASRAQNVSGSPSLPSAALPASFRPMVGLDQVDA